MISGDDHMSIRFGILGAGRIAHRFCQAANGIDRTLQAVASRDRERAREFQESYHIATMYGSYGEMLADPDVDCVYVATPHGLHFEHMQAVLNAGKHVLCEKAFTLNRAQAEEIFALAREKRLFVMEAMWTRFLPVIQEVQETIQKGEIGDVTALEATFGFPSPADETDRLFDPRLGGGALLDVTLYPITLANLILGIPERITAKAHFGNTGVDLTDKIWYQYGDLKAVLSGSIETALGFDARITGTKGSILMPHFWATDRATVMDPEGKTLREIFHSFRVNGLEYEIMEAEERIESGEWESPVMPWSETLEILRQMDEIRSLWNFRYPQENR
jgi:predicted dehydrogenase